MLKLKKSQVLTIDSVENFDHLFKQTIEKVKDVTAFFIMSDELMVRTFHLLRQSGYKIPEDCSLIAHNTKIIQKVRLPPPRNSLPYQMETHTYCKRKFSSKCIRFII